MAWNNDDWVWVADGPTGGIYRNKYNPELYADANGAVGTAETFGLGKSSGISYTTKVDSDGSVTGVPGATYQLGSNGSVSIVSRPSSGGGTTIINTPIQQQAGRYVTNVDTTGAITGIPGAVYQQDTYDGSITIVSKPAPAAQNVNPADKNNDGLDDTTNMAVGVFRDPTNQSPTGYIYGDGQPVWPNGAPYTGDGGTGKAPTLVNGKYIWDGSKFVVAPGLESTASSGGGTYISSAPSRSTSSSFSSTQTRDYASEQAASDARQAQMAADARAWQAAQNDIDRQIRAQEFQANYGLNVAQFQAQQARDQAAQKSSDLRDFSNAVSDTDMAKFQAVLYANGYNAGGTINNRLKEDPNAFFSELANVRAAGLLDQIRNGYGSVAAPGIPATGGLGTTGSAPAGAGTAGGAPSQPGATTGTLPSTQQNQGGGAANSWKPQPAPPPPNGPGTAQYEQFRAEADRNLAYQEWQKAKAADDIRFNPANWENAGTNDLSGYGGTYMVNKVSGERLPLAVYSQMMANDRSAAQNASDEAAFWKGASVTGDGEGFAIRPVIYDSLGQASGTSVQNVAPWAAGFTGYGPQQTEMPYGNDNIQRAVGGPSIDGYPLQPKGTGVYTGPSGATTGPYAPGSFGGGSVAPTSTAPWDVPSGIAGVPLLNDNGTAGTAPTAGGEQWMGTNSAIQPRAVVAMAHGGGPVSGSLIVGDPQRPGVPNPELVTGDNIRVTPLNQMPAPVAGSLMMGMPKAATGTDPWAWMGTDWNQSDYVDASGNAYVNSTTTTPTSLTGHVPRHPTTAPTTQTTTPVATTAGSGTTTSPVAPTTPSTVSTPSTGTSPTSSAPATGSLTPTGQTVQQPTAPAPATGGLGSITDIVNGTATPTSQALLDEIAQWRQSVPLPNVDPLSLEFQRLDPLTQQSILQARQTKSYIPVAAQQYEINKYRIGGGRALAGSLAF